MKLKTYCIGLVIGPCGLNYNQIVEVQHRLKEIAKAMDDDGVVRLIIPGMKSPYVDAAKPKEAQRFAAIDKMELDVMSGLHFGESLAFLENGLRKCDEVWTCPGKGQDTRMGQSKINQLWQRAQSRGGEEGRRFKKIPDWIKPSDEAYKSMKEKKQ